MKILIAGASGFIGTELVKEFATENKLTLLGRDKNKLHKKFSNLNNIEFLQWQDLNKLDAKNFDVVINLAGHNISEGRWSNTVKEKIINSRVRTTETLVSWILQNEARNISLINANAVGYYGMQENGDETALTEDTFIDENNPRDFLSEITIKWQNPLKKLIVQNYKVTILRFGVVLQKGQGMLKKLAPPFYLGAGTIVGDGKQYISWVHIRDLINVFKLVVDGQIPSGIYNLTSPNPVTQRKFAETFAKVLGRPVFLTMPAFVVKLLFGEMGDSLLLHGQKVVPKRLLDAGFNFTYPTIRDALEVEFK